MSQAKPTSVPIRGPKTPGLPSWAGPAIVALGLTCGMGLAFSAGELSWTYTALFAVGALVAVLFVNVRGIFLTVSSIPVLFAVFSLLTGAQLSSHSGFGSNKGWSSTSLLTGIYPVFERFPSLLCVTVGCAFLGVVKLLLYRSALRSRRARDQVTRRAGATTDRRGTAPAKRPRQQTRKLTVAELAARNAASRPKSVRERERDREQRRLEQAAQARVERGRPLREALERDQQERVARARAEREKAEREKAKRAKRPGGQPLSDPPPRGRHTLPDSVPPTRLPAPEKRRPVRRHRLDENLYDQD